MMRTLRLTIAYDGTNYHGWMYHASVSTVQGAIQAAIEKIAAGRPFELLGSSRTDAGVHALGQVARLRMDSAIPTDALARAIQAGLPGDIQIRNVEEVPESFHPIQDTLRKRYRYLLHDGPRPELFLRNYLWRMGKKTVRLDVDAMRSAANVLLGKHDFSAFENVGSPREHSVRTILDIDVRRGVPEGEFLLPLTGVPEDILSIEVEADGFLYNMVRNLAGTLAEVGRKRLSADGMADILQSRDRSRAGMTAPPQGLFLLWIQFRESGF
ncbi:MAG: tRNA pseudouridine(38-40) synthase TruA [Planctomycetia bacterium]|nr:tRNA pseudouridine(38-40) synthase TruA [Planctomycetia bacterium]